MARMCGPSLTNRYFSPNHDASIRPIGPYVLLGSQSQATPTGVDVPAPVTRTCPFLCSLCLPSAYIPLLSLSQKLSMDAQGFQRHPIRHGTGTVAFDRPRMTGHLRTRFTQHRTCTSAGHCAFPYPCVSSAQDHPHCDPGGHSW